MAFIPTANTAKVILNGLAAATPIINTLWFSKADTFTAADLDTLITGVHNWWYQYLRDELSNKYVLESIQAYDMSDENGPVTMTEYGDAGTFNGDFGSAQDVMRVKFGTQNRGRSGRGGNDISPLYDIILDDNKVAAYFRLAVAGAYALLNPTVAIALPGTVHAVVSFWNNKVPRAAGLVQDVVSYSVVKASPRTRKTRRSSGN